MSGGSDSTGKYPFIQKHGSNVALLTVVIWFLSVTAAFVLGNVWLFSLVQLITAIAHTIVLFMWFLETGIEDWWDFNWLVVNFVGLFVLASPALMIILEEELRSPMSLFVGFEVVLVVLGIIVLLAQPSKGK
jgi:hypothetical protein